MTRHFILKADDLRLNHSTEKFLRLFDICRRYAVPVSVGAIGSCIRGGRFEHREKIAALHRAGDIELWNHSFTHRDMTAMTEHDIALEITQTNAVCLQELGIAPSGFGAPYNKSSAAVERIALELGMRFSYERLIPRAQNVTPEYNVPFDGQPNLAVFTQRMAARTHYSVIAVQVHPGRWLTRGFAEFERVLQWLLENGYSGTTPTALLRGMEEGAPAPRAVVTVHDKRVADLTALWRKKAPEYDKTLSNFSSYFLARFAGNAAGINTLLQTLDADLHVIRVADVGCGLGQWALPFLEYDKDCIVHAFDTDSTVCAALNDGKAAGLLPERLKVHHEDFTASTALHESNLNRIVCANALSYIPVLDFIRKSSFVCKPCSLVILLHQTAQFNYTGYRDALRAGNSGMARERAGAEIGQYLTRCGFGAFLPSRTTHTLHELEALFYTQHFFLYDDFVPSWERLDEGRPTFQGMIFEKNPTQDILSLAPEYRMHLRKLLCRAGYAAYDDSLHAAFPLDMADRELLRLKTRALGSHAQPDAEFTLDRDIADALNGKEYARACRLISASDTADADVLLAGFHAAFILNDPALAGPFAERLRDANNLQPAHRLCLSLHHLLQGEVQDALQAHAETATQSELAA